MVIAVQGEGSAGHRVPLDTEPNIAAGSGSCNTEAASACEEIDRRNPVHGASPVHSRPSADTELYASQRTTRGDPQRPRRRLGHSDEERPGMRRRRRAQGLLRVRPGRLSDQLGLDGEATPVCGLRAGLRSGWCARSQRPPQRQPGGRTTSPPRAERCTALSRASWTTSGRSPTPSASSTRPAPQAGATAHPQAPITFAAGYGETRKHPTTSTASSRAPSTPRPWLRAPGAPRDLATR